MTTISFKLTLSILVLPILLISTCFVVIIYLYSASIDASGFLSAISTLISTILVNLLVWERLRDSTSKKLEYLHTNFLLKLHNAFKDEEALYFYKEEVKEIRSDLDKYGTFMLIHLYPKNLLKNLDEFLFSHGEFYNRLQKVNELMEKLVESYNRDLLYHFIGIRRLPLDSDSLNQPKVKLHSEKCQLLMKDNPELIKEIKDLLEKTKKLRILIFNKLEDFMKSNNLRLPEKPIYDTKSFF